MKRSVWLIVGGIALVALLAGGAFVAGRLLSQQAPSTAASGDGIVTRSGGPGGTSQQVSVHSMPAPELPQTPSDASGIFVRSEDNSVFIGTGEATMMAKGSPGQAPETSSNYSGPVVEVVINQDTTIYRDTTKLPDNPSGDVQVQQTVGPGSIDDIGQNSMIQVWGKKTGDRVVAQVLVYSQPTILNGAPVPVRK